MLHRVSLVSTNILLCLFILQLTSSEIVDNAPNQEEVYEAINTAPVNNERWVTKGPPEATKVPIRPEKTWVQRGKAGLQGILPMAKARLEGNHILQRLNQLSRDTFRRLIRQHGKPRLTRQNQFLRNPDVPQVNFPEQLDDRLTLWDKASPEKIRELTAFDSREHGNVKEPINEFQMTPYPQQTYEDPQQADIQLPRLNSDPLLPPPAKVEPPPEPQMDAPHVGQGSQPFKLPVNDWDSWHTQPQPARDTLSYDDQSNYDYQQPKNDLAEYPATVQGVQDTLPRSPLTYEQPTSGLGYVTYDVTPQSPVIELPIDVYNRAVWMFLSTKTPTSVNQWLEPVAYSWSDYQAAYKFAESYVAQYKAILGMS